jgi:hypothetical protein
MRALENKILLYKSKLKNLKNINFNKMERNVECNPTNEIPKVKNIPEFDEKQKFIETNSSVLKDIAVKIFHYFIHAYLSVILFLNPFLNESSRLNAFLRIR